MRLPVAGGRHYSAIDPAHQGTCSTASALTRIGGRARLFSARPLPFIASVSQLAHRHDVAARVAVPSAEAARAGSPAASTSHPATDSASSEPAAAMTSSTSASNGAGPKRNVRAEEAAAAAKAAAEEAYAATGGPLRTKRPPGMIKRSIAMHVGYVGTAFNGLQVNRESATDSTVEAVLERAVYGAGLIAESNFGDLKKIKWTRNSRTDKGVHSVSTVVGLRVLLGSDERFDTDPEGLQLAAALNERLPAAVRVFSAQRVNKKFNARRFCFDRTYEYLLPAYLLVPPAAGSGSGGGGRASPPAQRDLDPAEVSAALERLRQALQCYVGTHPFQNYTARRKTYVDTAKDREARKAAREAAAAEAAEAEAGAGASTSAPAAAAAAAAAADDVDELEAAAEAAAAAASAAAGEDVDESEEDEGEGGKKSVRQRRKEAKEARAQDDPLEEDDEEEVDSALEDDEGYEPGGAPRPWTQSCHWLYEKSADKRDRVTVRHFRSITSFTADEPAPLVPGGIPCVRLRVRGMSFMLHQIRHMIGGALSVARGMLPMELLAASLCAHSRVTVPRAPPHTLILADCTFPPFRKAGGDEARVARWSGDRLTLRQGGQDNLAAFRGESLDPALNELLSHPDWERFERCLPRFYWDPQAQQEVIAAHRKWEALRTERAAAKKREAEELAAAEAAAAVAAAAAGVVEGAAATGAAAAAAPAAEVAA